MNSKLRARTGIPNLKEEDGNPNSKLTTNDKEKAEVLAKYFCKVFTEEPEGDVPVLDSKPIIKAFKNIEIDKEIIERHLESLNISKSPGPDGLHPRFLKETAREISIPLKVIFITSLRIGNVPRDWRDGEITALFKKGDKTDPSNYRPISLTSVVCKIMEKVIRDGIMEHMRANGYLSKQQYGFIHGRSTTLQLLTVLEKWTKAVDDGNEIDCIYFDFMKAFDKVPHNRLLSKLKSYNIDISVQAWVAAFLRERRQRVVVNGEKSAWTNVISGIPQGTVLGPILFVLYINDLPENVRSDLFMFADDTKVSRVILDKNDRDDLQQDIYNLQSWSEKWLLKFHPDKCVKMSINHRGEESHYKFNISEDSPMMRNVRTEKDIGIHIDEKLEFDIHISEKINKANNIFNLIRRSFRYLNENNFLPLYKALVRPHLEQGNAVWSPFKMKYVDAIENVQRRATRMIPTLRGLTYPERLKKLRLPSLSYRRIRGDMIEVYKMLSGVYDEEVPNILRLQSLFMERSGNRGHSLKLYHQHWRRGVRGNFFSVRVARHWNSLPQSVVESPSLNTFKNRLDKLWGREPIIYDPRASTQTLNSIVGNVDLTIEA